MEVNGYKLRAYKVANAASYYGERVVNGYLLTVCVWRGARMSVAVRLASTGPGAELAESAMHISRCSDWDSVSDAEFREWLPIAIRMVENEIAEELERTAAAIRGEVL